MTDLPVPLTAAGRMRRSYRPGPRISSRISFSFSRRLILVLTAVEWPHLSTNQQTRQVTWSVPSRKCSPNWFHVLIDIMQTVCRNILKTCNVMSEMSSCRLVPTKSKSENGQKRRNVFLQRSYSYCYHEAKRGGVYILIHIFKANYRKGLKFFVEIA